MKLILARHGNTFRPEETAYYVGSQHDLPLVAFGRTQAELIGQYLSTLTRPIVAVYTGPLQRMQMTARIALNTLSYPIEIMTDTRLNELDYGLWSGLTSEEVRTRFGDDNYDRWERQSLWPKECAWGESEAEVSARIAAFAQDLVHCHAKDDHIVIVASNGCLRYFLKLIPHAFEQQIAKKQLKIGTGHLCQIEYHQDKWQLNYWNQAPQNLITSHFS
ncbi:MAG TPA: histidine phosphatase family protein [Legionellaceae bacterium]|nr:histidine phosphatase family protein [Legionellaceae bacterium]